MANTAIETEFHNIAEKAETYFKRPDVEADWRTALKQPEYLALVERFKVAEKAEEDACAGQPKTPYQIKYHLWWSSAHSWCFHSMHAYKKINTRLKARRHAQTRQSPPLKDGDIYASDVHKEFGVTPAKLHAIADKVFFKKLAYWGLESNLCDYNYDGAHWDAHKCEVEEAKQKRKVVCICQIDFTHPMYPSHPLGEGHFYGRKVYSRSAIAELINNEKLRRTEKVISLVAEPNSDASHSGDEAPGEIHPKPNANASVLGEAEGAAPHQGPRR